MIIIMMEAMMRTEKMMSLERKLHDSEPIPQNLLLQALDFIMLLPESHLFMPLASGFIWHKDPGFIRGRPDNARRSRELSEEMIWHFFHGSLVA